jgi:hypothetical protein
MFLVNGLTLPIYSLNKEKWGQLYFSLSDEMRKKEGKDSISSALGNFFTLENFGLCRAQNQTPLRVGQDSAWKPD